MPHNLANDSIIKKTKEHLYDCKSRHGQHAGCPGGVTLFLPSRVIQVGTHAKPKICVDNISRQAEYVALSYCWGGDQIVKLEARHILDGKPWHLRQDLLPQTFSDAIITTPNLGIEYLWIDGLCIVQDDEEDKAKEINSMWSIYKNATLKFLAAGSDSVTKGFLQPRLLPYAAWLPFLQPDGTFEAMGIVDKHWDWHDHDEPLAKRM